MRLLLVRHPEPDIAPGHCYGRLDMGLSAAGQASVPDLARRLRARGIARVWTSPSRRCRILAEAVVASPTVDPRLLELDFGAWEGRRWDLVDRAGLDAWAASPTEFAPPGGESGASLLRRVSALCDDLLRAGLDTIVVTHGGPLRLMPALLDGRAPDLLAAAPPIGSITEHHRANTESTTHSATTAQAPSTSPVKPPI